MIGSQVHSEHGFGGLVVKIQAAQRVDTNHAVVHDLEDGLQAFMVLHLPAPGARQCPGLAQGLLYDLPAGLDDDAPGVMPGGDFAADAAAHNHRDPVLNRFFNAGRQLFLAVEDDLLEIHFQDVPDDVEPFSFGCETGDPDFVAHVVGLQDGRHDFEHAGGDVAHRLADAFGDQAAGPTVPYDHLIPLLNKGFGRVDRIIQAHNGGKQVFGLRIGMFSYNVDHFERVGNQSEPVFFGMTGHCQGPRADNGYRVTAIHASGGLQPPAMQCYKNDTNYKYGIYSFHN